MIFLARLEIISLNIGCHSLLNTSKTDSLPFQAQPHILCSDKTDFR